MKEILAGVFHWKVEHPRIKIDVDCHFVAASGTAIDPLLPPEGIEWFEGRNLQQVVLSNRHHLRHGAQLAERFGCPILCHEAGLHEFEAGPPVDGFALGDQPLDESFEHPLFAHGDPLPGSGRETPQAIAAG